MENDEDIRKHVEEFFRNLYTNNRPLRPKVDGLNMPHLREGQAEWLDRPFDEEVKKVVRLLDGDMAPSPNGFTLAFYKTCWEVIQMDLMLVIKDFAKKSFLDKGSNATYISLIPKKEGAGALVKFHPISLLGSTY